MNTQPNPAREVRRIRKELNRLLEYPLSPPVAVSIRTARVLLKNALTLLTHGEPTDSDAPHHD